MIRAIPVRILRQVLLVIVGAEAFSFTEITQLSCRSHAAGRDSVDVAVDPAVDQTSPIEAMSEFYPKPRPRRLLLSSGEIKPGSQLRVPNTPALTDSAVLHNGSHLYRHPNVRKLYAKLGDGARRRIGREELRIFFVQAGEVVRFGE